MSQKTGKRENTRDETRVLALSLCIMHMPTDTSGNSELGGANCAAVLGYL